MMCCTKNKSFFEFSSERGIYVDKKQANRDQLFQAVLSLQTLEECIDFLTDLCTVQELAALEQRMEVARLLMNGHTYEMIEAETNARSTTISRVRKCLAKEQSGFQLAFDRLQKAERSQAH